MKSASIRYATALLAFGILIFSSISGFLLGVLVGTNDASTKQILAYYLMSGILGSTIMSALSERKLYHWVLMFPTAGILSGLLWSHFPTNNDGVRIVIACSVFVLIYFCLRLASRQQANVVRMK